MMSFYECGGGPPQKTSGKQLKDRWKETPWRDQNTKCTFWFNWFVLLQKWWWRWRRGGMENITFPELIAFWHKVTSRAKSLTYFCKGTKTRQKENNLQERTKHQGTHRPSSADWVCQSGLYNLPHKCQSGWPSHLETLTYSLTSCSPLPLVICSLTNKPKFTQNVNTNSLCINFVEMIGSILYNTNHIKSICSKCDEAGTEQRTW